MRRATRRKKAEQDPDSDLGARYIGEFSLGFNPRVLQPMRDILFDEKIAGSFHSPRPSRTKKPTTETGARFTGHGKHFSRPDYGGRRSTLMAN